MTENHEYLWKVAEAIQNRKISQKEAIAAGTINSAKLTQLLKRHLPFVNHTICGIKENRKGPTPEGYDTVLPKARLVTPTQSIVNTMNNHDFASNVAKLESHERLYSISDAVGSRIEGISDEGYARIMENPYEYAEGLDFRLLDWTLTKPSVYTHQTPVEKMSLSRMATDKTSIVREDLSRLSKWKDIHHTIEGIAARTMKENGLHP